MRRARPTIFHRIAASAFAAYGVFLLLLAGLGAAVRADFATVAVGLCFGLLYALESMLLLRRLRPALYAGFLLIAADFAASVAMAPCRCVGPITAFSACVYAALAVLLLLARKEL